MSKTQIRGTQRKNEHVASSELRDVRTIGQKISEGMEKPEGIIFASFIVFSAMYLYTSVAEIFFIIGMALFFWVSRKEFSLPFRMPSTSGLLDPNDPKIGTELPGEAKGIAFLGNERETNKELWFTASDMKTHLLVFGSTGAGKTETLISLAFNCLVQGSGFIYVDGKGDNSLWAKIFSICRSVGREDDLLVINYMTGGRDVFGPQEKKLSNTLNPFISGSSGGLTELLVGLMDEAGGDNAMWKGRAISLVSGIMMALVWLRDNDGLLLDVDVIRDYLILENIQKLDKRRDLPANIRQAITSYLKSLPGYNANAPKQSETVMDQHGYLQMQFTKILGSLSDMYGYIFRTNLGEVDFFDVVVNRRILCVLLPALEKSTDELANLGKIIVACLKSMMATGLGDTLEGDFAEVIEIKPTNAPAPYMCILDEYGYYVVKGAAVMPAQARSLGFSMVFAGQDYPAFKKNNMAEEAVSTIGNCNIKIFMKVEDPTETFDLFKSSVGEAIVSKTSGLNFQAGSIVNTYMDGQNAVYDKRSRGDLLDLKDQKEGQAHIIFKSTLVRANMFYAAPKNVGKLQLNYFLRVTPPTKDEISDFLSGVRELTKKLVDSKYIDGLIDSCENSVYIDLSNNIIKEMHNKHNKIDLAVIQSINAVQKEVFANIENYRDGMNRCLSLGDNDDDEIETIDIFKDELNDLDEEEFYGSREETNNIFLDIEKTSENFKEIEKANGANQELAEMRSQQILEDMRKASEYPRTKVPDEADPSDILDLIKNLEEEIQNDQ